MRGTIDSCYNTGEIYCESGYRQFCGGLVGELNYSTIKNSYNIGNIGGQNGTRANYCGIIGWSDKSNTIRNNYCTTEIAYSYGSGNWGTSMSTSNRIEANTLKTYESTLGEAFTSDIENQYNEGYPILEWQIPSRREQQDI